MTPRLLPGTLVRWCIHPNRPCVAIVLSGEIKTLPYSPGCALVTIRDVEDRRWVERDVVLLIGDLVAVGRGEAAEVVPIGVPAGGGCRMLPAAE